MIRPKNETEVFLMSITESCETLIKQTHRKNEATLEFKKNKPRETFHFKPPILLQGSWMIGLMSLEVYNSVFNITQEKKQIQTF